MSGAMRNVLIVAPYFAPQSHAAVFRAYKLAKYLPRFGYRPFVVTTDRNYLYNEDARLLPALPSEVSVHRARYVEPTLRGLRMALGGRDRGFRAVKAELKQKGFAAAPSDENVHLTGTGFSPTELYSLFLKAFVQAPDEYWPWFLPALTMARELAKEHQIELVYTTCVPYTVHAIGLALQASGLSWVADFRDPCAYTARQTSRFDHIYMMQRAITRETLRRADACTALSSSYPLIFRDMFGPMGRPPAEFIPTGLDDALIPAMGEVAVREKPYLVFAGEYLREYGSEFLEIFARALGRPEVAATGIELLVIGHELINRQRMGAHIERLGLLGRTHFIDHLPQSEYYRYLAGAVGALLIPGRTAHWWNNFAKMVDYIALKRPVVAMVPNPSEARAELSRARLGVFLDGARDEAEETLARFLVNPKAFGAERAPDEVCRRYLASQQVASFAGVFDRVLAARHGAGGVMMDAKEVAA